MLWLISARSGIDARSADAFGDVTPLLLAMLDFRSLQQLSSVSRSAATSTVRRHVLQQSAVQLSADSTQVHTMLRSMAMREHLYTVEIRNCWAKPLAIPDLQQLLSVVSCVKISREPTLNCDVEDQVDALITTKISRIVDREDFTRRVRRRLAKQGLAQHLEISSSPRVVDNIRLWLQAAPATLLELDLQGLRIDDLRWLGRFHGLRKLHFDASTSEPVENFLQPLMEIATLKELVVDKLQVSECSELRLLTELQTLELRGARGLTSLDFLTSLHKLETVVLSDVRATNLTPLMNLPALKDLTLDSVGARAAVALGGLETVTNASWPRLEKLQLMFVRGPVARFLHQCPHLVHFHLCETKFTQWLPLSSLQQLETISLSVDGVKDWSPLAQLPRLKRVAFDSKFGRIDSKHFVKGWSALQEVISPPWDDYSSLVENAGSLTRLELLGWRLRDSSSLETLRNARRLDSLRIAFVPGAVDLSSLSELTQLRRLELWSASVVSIGFLRELENLVELQMPTPFGASAAITDFSPLTKLKNLKTLVLRGRREFVDAHVDVVMQLPMLKNLDVEGSGVTHVAMQRLQRRSQPQTQTGTRRHLA